MSASRKAQQTLALLPSPGFVAYTALRCRVKSKVGVLDAKYRLSDKSGVTLLGKMKEDAPHFS